MKLRSLIPFLGLSLILVLAISLVRQQLGGFTPAPPISASGGGESPQLESPRTPEPIILVPRENESNATDAGSRDRLAQRPKLPDPATDVGPESSGPPRGSDTIEFLLLPSEDR